MTGPPSLDPKVLDCPDARVCPVVPTLEVERIQLATIDRGTPLFRCYDSTWGYDEFNPGYGDARFSPFPDEAGAAVPVLYAARTLEGALLETVFHDVHDSAERIVYESSLRQQLLAHVALPSTALVVDLRDDQLDRLGLRRRQVVSSSQEHYACTRRLARQIYGTSFSGGDGVHRAAQGVLWHSRQAELSGVVAEAVVLFGNRFGQGRGVWTRHGPGSRNLWESVGRQQVDEIAERLIALVVTG